jgi:leucyl/phenylalanyl-tRNA---protein transferase
MSRQSSFIRPTITPEQVLSAYQHGLFPMARGRYGSISWYIAEPRAVIPLDDRFRVRRSLRQVVERGEHGVTVNEDFEAVIRACARHDDVTSEEVWLSEEMIALYVELHRRGHAHSVEVRRDGALVGGLYGIALGGAFFGESMFSRAPFGSQLALVALVARLRARGYALLDAQVMTPHLEQFGTLSLSHQDYITLLMRALREECKFV